MGLLILGQAAQAVFVAPVHIATIAGGGVLFVVMAVLSAIACAFTSGPVVARPNYECYGAE